MKRKTEIRKKIITRLTIILIIYLIILLLGAICIKAIYKEITPELFKEPIIKVDPFLDDFINAKFSCSGNETEVNFIVKDEFGNTRHNSSATINCDTFTKISLQGSPLDFTKDREYIVYASFNNQTINSGYFSFKNVSTISLIKIEIISFFAFMINQNNRARGTYSDRQRLLWVETGDPKFAENALLANLVGLLYVLDIFLGIDLAIWMFVWVRSVVKKGKKTKKKF